MSSTPLTAGTVGWTDLTVRNAERVRDFYSEVVGWKYDPVDMGGYSDYTMLSSDGSGSAGVCHARGVNTGLPAQWLIYITVDNIEVSIGRCTHLGGKVIAGPKGMGGTSKYCVIEDPAGAVCALYQPK
jgi:predicted enzyme related to lactoylglutathione lyase